MQPDIQKRLRAASAAQFPAFAFQPSPYTFAFFYFVSLARGCTCRRAPTSELPHIS